MEGYLLEAQAIQMVWACVTDQNEENIKSKSPPYANTSIKPINDPKMSITGSPVS